jgi:hypothetical protein
MDLSNQEDRIEHAIERYIELSTDLVQWIMSDPWNLRVEISEEKRNCEVFVDITAAPPINQWSLLCGEIVHHLRAALDNVAYSMAIDSGESDEEKLRWVYFPICATEEEWGRVVKGKISSLAQKYQDAIYETQPFLGLNDGFASKDHILSIIQELDNKDKHRIVPKVGLPIRELEYKFEPSLRQGDGYHRNLTLLWKSLHQYSRMEGCCFGIQVLRI